VQSLPALAGSDPVVTGASLDASGDPVLLLDPSRLVERAPRFAPAVDAPPPPRPPILVIDDSLTTRMLEQSILESAGYEVDVAISAEEALVKAHARAYGLFVCDVEMPGMNGFEFVAEARGRPALSKIPTILVTSLSSAADRRRGEESGAAAYMVKGEFDQQRLLELIDAFIDRCARSA
jgi:two-component system chemotaxis sensor kinase CheA